MGSRPTGRKSALVGESDAVTHLTHSARNFKKTVPLCVWWHIYIYTLSPSAIYCHSASLRHRVEGPCSSRVGHGRLVGRVVKLVENGDGAHLRWSGYGLKRPDQVIARQGRNEGSSTVHFT
jgi:hypothetical protein